MQNKIVVVTGATRGIGKAIAINLAKEGAKIAGVYRSDNADLENLKKEMADLGAEFLAVKADVADFESSKEAIDAVNEHFGRVDVLVNNAGITKDGLLMRMKEADFDSVINTNLKGVFNMSQAATKYMMKQRYGRIINISSVVGLTGNAGQANYAASKAGVIGFTKSIAREFASRNITANAIAPGFIETDMTHVLSDKVKDSMLSTIPLNRAGNGEDISNAISFLASDKANYITGQVLAVDGGMTMQ